MLQIVKKYAGEGVFEPDEVLILIAAFEEAWQRLEKSGVRFDSDYQRTQARNRIGKYIIDEAKAGERDSGRLSDSALLLYSKSASSRR
jgi:hypothetical protein